MRGNFCRRAAQANVEFIGGFFLFLITVVFVVFSVVNSVPSYQEGMREGAMRLEAWKASENFLRQTESGGEIDDAMLSVFRSCRGYNYNDLQSRQNYTRVKSLLDVKESDTVHILFEHFPIAILGGGGVKSGTVLIESTSYFIEARNTSLVYDEIRVSGGAWTRANSEVDFGGDKYIIVRIDPRGEFVIFKSVMLDCGPSPLAVRMAEGLASNLDQVEAKRYVNYDNHIARFTLTYW